MATNFPLPNLPLEWSKSESWLEQFGFYIISAGLDNDKKKATFLANCGPEAFDLVRGLLLPDKLSDDRVKFDLIEDGEDKVSILQKLTEHLKPKKILHYERYKFFCLRQKSRSVHQFVADLRTFSATCELGTLKSELLLTQFIIGVDNTKLKERFLSKAILSFETAIQEALLMEESTSAASAISSTAAEASAVCAFSPVSGLAPSKMSTKTTATLGACNSCGGMHSRASCKLRDAKCYKCQRNGHIARVCNSEQPVLRHTRVNKLEINHIAGANSFLREVIISRTMVTFLIDTGSPVTIISSEILSKVGGKLAETEKSLKCYSGIVIQTVGACKLTLEDSTTGRSASGEVLVVREGKCILGRDFIEMLDVLSVNQMAASDVLAQFHLKGGESILHGKIFPPRSLAHGMKLKVEEDIKQKLKDGILIPCENPIVSAPIVPVIKSSGAVRVCGDYTLTANQVIDAGSYHIPTFDEIIENIGKVKFYFKIDLKDAYLQIPLSEAAQRYTTVSTHLGNFSFTRLPFGISASPRIFQEFMDKVLADIPGVRAYQDDILGGGATRAEHDVRLREVQDRLAHYNLTPCSEKSVYCVKKVLFLGYILEDGSVQTDPERLAAFERIKSPVNKQQLKSVLGTLQYYCRFMKNFSTVAAPLHDLLKKTSKYLWTDDHENILRKLIDTMVKSAPLTIFDPQRPLFLICDGSATGVGAILTHDSEQKEIIQCASRKLSPAEHHYSNIEREALAIIYGLNRFRNFLSGREFTIISDHAPLQFIFDKTKGIRENVSARLQRWQIALRAHDFKVISCAGHSMHLPDTLSRIPYEEEIQVSVVDQYLANESKLIPVYELIKNAYRDDLDMIKLKRYIVADWPANVPNHLRQYSADVAEYCIHDGCIYRGFRLLVPQAMRNKVLALLHEGHVGIERMRRLCRMHFWWPRCDSAVGDHVLRCVPCQKARKIPVNKDLRSWSDTSAPMERLHVDVAHRNGKNFLVIYDVFSSWGDVHILKRLASDDVIIALRETFKYTLLPKCLVSDNGTCFTSEEFRHFCENNKIRHVTSPAYHKQSNGSAEKFIDTFKIFLNKNDDGALPTSLLVLNFCVRHNTTPTSSALRTPIEEILAYTPRTRLSASMEENVSKATNGVLTNHNGAGWKENVAEALGSNTSVDGGSRLIHESRILRPAAELEVDKTPATDKPSVPAMDEPDVPADEPVLRRSTREKHTPERLTYY